jgi:hypothetical protein
MVQNLEKGARSDGVEFAIFSCISNFPKVFATMSYTSKPSAEPCVTTFEEFVRLADYSLMDTLNGDPDATGRW